MHQFLCFAPIIKASILKITRLGSTIAIRTFKALGKLLHQLNDLFICPVKKA